MEVIHERENVVDVKLKKPKRKGGEALNNFLFRFAIIFWLLVLWQYGVNRQWVDPFLMGSPSGIWDETVRLIQSGQLLTDTLATVYGTLLGFVLGSLLGSAAGLLLWYSRKLAKILDPFIVALNGLPKIALAPMIIIWFGSGITSKIALAALATFIVALLSAYQGTHQVDSSLVNLMKSLGAKNGQIFRKVILPSSLPWIISAFRLNIGFALIAVIGGEFISSDKGLGKMVFVAGNLFNLNVVWVGVLMIMVVAMILYAVVAKMEKHLLPWKIESKN